MDWDFNAPTFIDFEKNEHFNEGSEDFFASAKETDSVFSNENNMLPSWVNESKHSPKELPKNAIQQAYSVQTPSRETYFVPTPSRVLRSSVKQQKQSLNDSTNVVGTSTINIKSAFDKPKKSVQNTSVPQKRFKLTLPRTPNFASKNLKFKSRNSPKLPLSNSMKSNLPSRQLKKRVSSAVQRKNSCVNKSSNKHNVDTGSNYSKSCTNTLKPSRVLRQIPKKNQISKPVNCTPALKRKSNQGLTAIASKRSEIVPCKKRKVEATKSTKSETSAFSKRPSTIPVPFKFSNVKSSKRSITVEKEQPKPFKAQPVPPSIYQKPKQVKKIKELDITVPMSPAFPSKNLLKRKLPAEDNTTVTLTKQYHLAKKSAVFKPKLASSKTVPKPFSFDTKVKERLVRRSERIKDQDNTEVKPFQFKARPAPALDLPSKLPPREVRKSTAVAPFQLHCEERVVSRAKDLLRKNEQIVDLVENSALLKKPNKNFRKVLNSKPWKPNLDRKRSTKPVTPVFRSQARIQRREEARNEKNT